MGEGEDGKGEGECRKGEGRKEGREGGSIEMEGEGKRSGEEERGRGEGCERHTSGLSLLFTSIEIVVYWVDNSQNLCFGR